MDAIDNLLLRNSARELSEPHPTSEQMSIAYKAALRAPDHAWLRPSSFIEVTGNGLSKLSNIFERYSHSLPGISDEIKNKYKKAPFRAPMIIVIVNTIKDHPKVPPIEQKLSTAAAAQNIMLALNAMNYGVIWRTGKFAFNIDIQTELGLNKNQEILGYLYVGTSIGNNKKIPVIDINKYVSKL